MSDRLRSNRSEMVSIVVAVAAVVVSSPLLPTVPTFEPCDPTFSSNLASSAAVSGAPADSPPVSSDTLLSVSKFDTFPGIWSVVSVGRAVRDLPSVVAASPLSMPQ